MADFTPSPLQAEAVKAIVEWYRQPNGPQVFYLAGFAGTGKSTVYALVRRELRKHGARNVVTCAFTGKAANVLRKKGTADAMTVHAATYSPYEDPLTGKVVFVLNTEGPAAMADLIGLDECSMINDDMADDLISFGVKILVMGDPGQLPPIKGQGKFTAGRPDFFLHEIHRQALDSPILRLATWAREGKPIPLADYGDDVKVLRLTKESHEEVYRPDTQVLVGIHRVRHTITQMLRRQAGNDGPIPVPGERIICCRNDKKLGIFNGSLGVLDSIQVLQDGEFKLGASMEDLRAPITDVWTTRRLFAEHFGESFKDAERLPRGIKEFDWSYALTVHKSQGSEWPHVTVVDDSGVFREDRHKHLYTAITRASEGLTLLKRGA